MLKQGQGWSQSSVESRFYCRSEGGLPPRGASANLGIRGSGVSSSLSAPFSATVISSFSVNEQLAGEKNRLVAGAVFPSCVCNIYIVMKCMCVCLFNNVRRSVGTSCESRKMSTFSRRSVGTLGESRKMSTLPGCFRTPKMYPP